MKLSAAFIHRLIIQKFPLFFAATLMVLPSAAAPTCQGSNPGEFTDPIPVEAHLRLAKIHAQLSEISEGLLAGEHQQKSIDSLRGGLLGLQKSGTPEQIAYAHHQLGNALLAKSKSAPILERILILDEAEACVRSAVGVFTPEKHPLEHAMGCDTLSTILHARAQWPQDLDAARKAEWLKESEANARTALAIFETSGRKNDALRIRLNLFAFSDEIQSGSARERLEKTIRNLEAIIADPQLGKRSQTRAYAHRVLAGKLITLAESDIRTSRPHLDRAEKLLLAIPATRTSDHRSWGFVHAVLGRIAMTRSLMPEADQVGQLRQSLEHFDEALGVFTRESGPLEWGSIYLGRGLAISMLAGKGCDDDRYKLTDGLIAVFEAQNTLYPDPEASKERNMLIEMLKNPKATATPAPSSNPSTESIAPTKNEHF